MTTDFGGHDYNFGAGTTSFPTPNKHFSSVAPQHPSDGSAGTTRFTIPNKHFSGLVPQEPSDGSAGTTRFTTPNKHFSSVVPQEPSDGSAGTICFERQFHKSDGFCDPPRAPFIILIKARGMPESPPPGTPHRLISIIRRAGGKAKHQLEPRLTQA